MGPVDSSCPGICLFIWKPIQLLQLGEVFWSMEFGNSQNTACDMEEKGKASLFKSGSSSDSREGLVCQYQLKGSASQLVFLRVDRDTGALQVDWSLSFSTESHVEILSSCHGLLLLSHVEKKRLKYLVFDPISNTCVALPPHPWTNGKVLQPGLASNGNHFHVVLVHLTSIPHGESTGFMELLIFSSSTGEWRKYSPTKLCLPPSLASHVKPSNKLISSLTSRMFRLQRQTPYPGTRTAPTYSNGAIHWTISGHLLIYQVKGEHCELIELPYAHEGASHQQPKWDYQHCLWESGGRLKLSYTDESGFHTWHLLNDEDYDVHFWFNIYDRKKFRWRLEATISHQQLRRREPECCKTSSHWRPCDLSPVTCLGVLQLMHLRLPGAIISYNTDSHAMEHVCTFRHPDTKLCPSSFHKQKKRENCCSFFPFNFAGLNSITSESRPSEAAAIRLPLENLANHVYF